MVTNIFDPVTGAPRWNTGQAPQVVGALNQLADFAVFRGGLLRGTDAERQAFAKPTKGLWWWDEDRQLLSRYDGAAWRAQPRNLPFVDDAARDAFTAVYGPFLNAGDRCVSNGLAGYWDGAKWVQDTALIQFTAFNFGAGWSGAVTNGFNGVRYLRRGGVVYASGAVQNSGSWGVGSVIMSLPVGFRPPIRWTGSGVEIDAGGNIQTANTGSGIWVFSIQFPVA